MSSSDIRKKLQADGKIKLFETTYYYSLEKNIVRGSYVMLFAIFSVFYSNVPMALKVMNVLFLAPTVTIIFENYKNNTRFVVSIYLIENGDKIQILNHKGQTEIMSITDLKLASEDERVAQKKKLNHETYLIFTNKTNNNIYHLFRAGVFLDEIILEKMLEGKKLDQI